MVRHRSAGDEGCRRRGAPTAARPRARPHPRGRGEEGWLPGVRAEGGGGGGGLPGSGRVQPASDAAHGGVGRVPNGAGAAGQPGGRRRGPAGSGARPRGAAGWAREPDGVHRFVSSSSVAWGRPYGGGAKALVGLRETSGKGQQGCAPGDPVKRASVRAPPLRRRAARRVAAGGGTAAGGSPGGTTDGDDGVDVGRYAVRGGVHRVAAGHGAAGDLHHVAGAERLGVGGHRVVGGHPLGPAREGGVAGGGVAARGPRRCRRRPGCGPRSRRRPAAGCASTLPREPLTFTKPASASPGAGVGEHRPGPRGWGGRRGSRCGSRRRCPSGT